MEQRDSCGVLISIHPCHVNNILLGTKKFEFRRTRLTATPVVALLYATAPVQKLVGFASVLQVIRDDITRLWPKCHLDAGISHEEYQRYFVGLSIGSALRFGGVIRLERPVERQVLETFGPVPQSFRYVPRSMVFALTGGQWSPNLSERSTGDDDPASVCEVGAGPHKSCEFHHPSTFIKCAQRYRQLPADECGMT